MSETPTNNNTDIQNKDSRNENSSLDINEIRASIDIEAEKWRQSNPEIIKLEHAIEQEWLDIVPQHAIANDQKLLEKLPNIGLIALDFPKEQRRHIRFIKKIIYRVTFWYAQHLVGQINRIFKFLSQSCQQVDSRVAELEITTSLINEDIQNLCSVPDVSVDIASAVANKVGSKYCAVLSSGNGIILDSIYDQGGSGYGIEQDVKLVTECSSRGIDVRQGYILDHIKQLEDNSLHAIVISGIVELYSVGNLINLSKELKRVLDVSGIAIIAVTALENRTLAEKELCFGRGLSPHSWQYLMDKLGFEARLFPTNDSRIPNLVFAELL